MVIDIDTVSFITGAALLLYALINVEVNLPTVRLYRLDHGQRLRVSAVSGLFVSVGLVVHYVPDGNALLSVSSMIHSYDDVPNREATTFKSPVLDGERLDICLIQGFGCGLDAAGKWCRSQGFMTASSFEVEQVGLSHGKTRSVVDKSVCDNESCTAFTSITCVK